MPEHDQNAPELLRLRIAEFADAYAASESVRIRQYVDERFEIVTMYPEFRTTSRAEWLAGLRDYRLHQWIVRSEMISVNRVSAIHNRRAFRRASSQSGELSGEICVTDSWIHDPDHGWRIWHRFVSPVAM